MAFADNWKKACELVINSMKSELEANPDNEERRNYVMNLLAGVQHTLQPPPPEPEVTIEKLSDWVTDTYLPEGLVEIVPKEAEDIKLGLKLLSWYISPDFERRTRRAASVPA